MLDPVRRMTAAVECGFGAVSSSEKEVTIERQPRAAYEDSFVPHATDLLRGIGLLLLPWAYAVAGSAAFLAAALSWGGQWALRYFASTRWRDALGQLVLLGATIFSALGAYALIEWLDLAVHGLLMGVVVGLLHGTLGTTGLMNGTSPGGAWWRFVILVALGALLAVLWEIGEWAGYRLLDPRIGVGYDDTMGDLLAGLAGSALAASGVFRTDRALRGAGRGENEPG